MPRSVRLLPSSASAQYIQDLSLTGSINHNRSIQKERKKKHPRIADMHNENPIPDVNWRKCTMYNNVHTYIGLDNTY